MNKLLLVLSGLALATSAYAADDTQLKFNGEIRARYKNDMNFKGTKSGGQPAENQSMWEQRSIFGLTALKGENFTGHLKFLNASTWGRDGTTGDLTTTEINRTGQDNTVIMLESWVWWKASSMMSLRFGRGGMTIADGAVVDVNDYEQVPRVFEGVLGNFDFGFASLNVFGVKSAEISTGSSLLAYDKESNFSGLSFDFKNLPDAIKMANIHLIMENSDITSATAASGKNYTRYGLTIGGDVANFDFKGTYAGVTGKLRAMDPANDIKVATSMFDLAAGFTLAEVMNMRFGAVYHMDSGDNDDDAKTNNTYDPFNYNKHDYSGRMDVIGWGNLTYVGGNFSIMPMDKTTLGAEYLMFTRTSTKVALSNVSNFTAPTTNNDKSAVGSELDLWANHSYTDAFSIGALVGMFTPGEYLMYSGTTKTDLESASQLLVTASYKF